MNEPAENTPRCYSYTAFGLQFHSQLELPDLPETQPGQLEAISIRYGDIPEHLPNARSQDAHFELGDDDFLLRVDKVARFRVRGGKEIIVAPAAEASMQQIRIYLLSAAFGALLHQRGLLLLHTNAIEIDGRAVAFAGDSGAGKSTLAAYFAKKGYRVLCDDICALSFDDAGRCLAWPGIASLKLCADAATEFGHDLSTLDTAIDSGTKFRLPLARGTSESELPLAALYILERTTNAAESGIRQLGGMAILNMVMRHVYRGQYLQHSGRMQQCFDLGMQLVRQVPVYVATRHWGYDVYVSEAERLERHFLDNRA